YATLAVAQDPDGRVGYLTTFSSLDAGTILNLDDAIEIPRGAGGWGIDGYPAIWVTSWDEPTIVRYDLQDDGTFTEGDTIDFSGLGLANSGYQGGGILTPELATFFSPDIGGLVHWNPTTMEIVGTLPIGVPDQGDAIFSAWDVVGRPGDD